MSKVLVVDDEEVYRRQLEIALSSGGYDVKTASSGREAVNVGVRYQPNLLITDWMLKDHLHGLHVARVLRAVNPDIQTILVTGFASEDLRTEATKGQVFDFIEKPFDLDHIQAVVQKAGVAEKPPTNQRSLAVIEVDSNGSITFANVKAGDLFDETQAGSDAASLADIFPPEAVPDLDTAIDHWLSVSPRAEEPIVWQLRSQNPPERGHRLVVLRRPDEQRHMDLASVEMLLGFKDLVNVRWPFDGRVLVVDDEALTRGACVSILESIGAGCYGVESPARALPLLDKDDGLQFVILDFNIPGTTPRTTVESIKTIRPDVIIVGTSGSDHRDDFAEMGVEHFLQKPWQIDELVNLLTGRIGNCSECGLVVPLRRPKQAQAASSWVCCHCGTPCRPLFHDDLPPEVT